MEQHVSSVVANVLLALCSKVSSPVSETVKCLVVRAEWAKLQELRVRPSDYTDPHRYWEDSMLVELLRKCDIPNVGVDKEAAAVAVFYECEKQNCLSNSRLTRYLPEHLYLETREQVAVHDFISLWRKEVISLFGNLPESLTPRFSGGATFADTGELTTIPDKMSSVPTIYSETRCLLPLWEQTAWSSTAHKGRPWLNDVRTEKGNIFFTVPKDAVKHRGCAKEASIPVSYQLAVGSLLKKRLLNIGIDLRRGQKIHQDAAQAASFLDSRSTIDMSNASDTLCRVLVKLLLRGDWYELLNSLRAHKTRVKGRWINLEKFSSMGNGFTFELETIIFATLARVIVRQEGGDPSLVLCYGDDLIVPKTHTKSVMAALKLFGFTPNMKKTFTEGNFRESCGGDFMNGIPVRASYLEKLPDEPQHWISLANSLRRCALAHEPHSALRWSVVSKAWHTCLRQLPVGIRRCKGPERLGDIVIHTDREDWDIRDFKPPKGFRGFSGHGLKTVLAYTPIPVVLNWHHWTRDVQLASCTLDIPSAGVTPRGGVSGYRFSHVIIDRESDWCPPQHCKKSLSHHPAAVRRWYKFLAMWDAL